MSDVLAERSVIRSVSDSQDEILASIIELHAPEGFDCDLTFGKGGFWTSVEPPRLRFDIDPQVSGVTQADSSSLPLDDDSIGHTVFDPPFCTYVRAGRVGNGRMIMARQFGGYWRYDELESHYLATLEEARRVIRDRCVLVVKCQDIIHNHRMHATHANTIWWAEQAGFRLLDLFVLVAKRRLPSPNRRGVQRHARVFHSYFLVFV